MGEKLKNAKNQSAFNYFFPLHMDAGNRGCEAITRGTIDVLKLHNTQYVGWSKNLSVDAAVGIKEMTTLQQASLYSTWPLLKKLCFRIIRKSIPTKNQKQNFTYKLIYNSFLRNIDSICFLTGGDLLCYENNEVIYINDWLSKRGIPTILWGCSVGEENLTKEKVMTLKRFTLITTRETLTLHTLKNLGLKNVYCFPDPAFVLKPQETDLPPAFSNSVDVVGINLSNFVGKDVGGDTIRGKNILELVNTILKTTNFNVLLIPHVFWKGQDDRIICREVCERYKDTQRVFLCNSEKLNYCEIRYIISKCRFFVGARTHSIISAYAMQVPALALGYSVKSVGIAKEVGLDKELVVDSNSLQSVDEFSNAFLYMYEHEQDILETYKRMPNYIARAYEAKKVIDQVACPKLLIS